MLENQVAYVGESWSFRWPEAISKEDLDVTYNVTIGKAAGFVNYNEDTLTLFINENDTDDSLIGDY